jgi:hypothetical protein
VFFIDEPPVDGIFFGESTDCIARIFALCAEAKDAGLSKAETLTRLESVPGFILPDRPRTTKRFIDPAPSMNELLEGAPVFNLDGQFGTGNLQISEGCPCFCSFCAESFCRKPYREVAAGRALDEAAGMKAGMGLDKLELFSFNFNMHSEFYALLDGLSSTYSSIGLKSQRFDGIAADPGLLDLCIAAGKTSITCGLEGISPRLRRFLHKSLAEKDLRSSLSLVLSSPVRELKVFLIATGREDRHDLEEFSGLLRFIRDCAASHPSGVPRIIFSATPLVRFPWTPLEFDEAPQPEALRPIVAAIRGTVEAGGYEFRLSSDINDYYLSQMLVRAADPRIYGGLLSALRSTGYAYYRTVPTSFINEFVRECVARGLSHSGLLAPQAADDGCAPWLFFQTVVSRDFVRRQAEAANAYVDNGFCLGTAEGHGECKACNACGDDTDFKSAIVAPRCGGKGSYQPSRLREKIKKAVSSTQQVSLLVEVNDSCRGLPRAAVAVALASAIMKTEPACIPWYRGFAQSFQSPGNGPCWTTGDDIVTLLWLHDAIAALEAIVRDPEKLARVNLLFEKWGVLKTCRPPQPERYRLRVQSSLRFEPKSYFAGRGLNHTLRKSAGGYFCEFTKQALKKKFMFECAYSATPEGGTTISLEVSPKFNAEDFAKEAFAPGTENEWVRVRMRSDFF